MWRTVVGRLFPVIVDGLISACSLARDSTAVRTERAVPSTAQHRYPPSLAGRKILWIRQRYSRCAYRRRRARNPLFRLTKSNILMFARSRISPLRSPTGAPACLLARCAQASVRRTGRRADTPHRISRRLVGNHEGCPYKCNGVDNHEGCPRTQTGALLFRPFSWAGNERQPAASPPPPFSPFPLRKGGRGDRSLYRNTSTGFARSEWTT